MPHSQAHGRTVRFATFNAALYRPTEGQLLAELSTPYDTQARAVAEVIQRSRPDVLLLNEFDYVAGGAAAEAFHRNYLEVGQHGARGISYPYVYVAAVNSGEQTGFDLNRDGVVGDPSDAHGYGAFVGQYGMLMLSEYPIDMAGVRTFRRFRWQDMPGALLPDDPDTAEAAAWYPAAALQVLRLSSRSHWDIPLQLGHSTVHLLAAHPTPPLFDGPENSNVRRNHDEIRFWADYVTPGAADYIYDDAGCYGGLPVGARFVIAGDLNADPVDGFRLPGAVEQLLDAPGVHDPRPGSAGGVLAALRQNGTGLVHVGNPFYNTSDFGDDIFGNMRLDYVLPSAGMTTLRQGVFWPVPGTPLARLSAASDHHLVWVDVALPDAAPR